VPLAVICYLAAPFFFPLISSDSDITRIGTPLLSILCLAVPAIGMHNAFNGHWTGLEKPRVYMLIVLFMNCLNTLLNYALIFGHFGAPALGATGAAISTVLSLYVGVIIHCVIVYSRFRNDGFLSANPGRSLVVSISRLGLPINITAFFFGIGYVVFLWLMGQVGTAELAAANVLVRITMVLEVLASSLGMASATLVSRTVGEGDSAEAARWGWSAGKLGVVGITLLGFPILLFPKAFLSIFLSDAHTISIAIIPMRLEAAMAGIISLIYIFGYTLSSHCVVKETIMIRLPSPRLFNV
jgi:putative MATE family efflux protein